VARTSKPVKKTVVRQWDIIEVTWIDAIGPSPQLSLSEAMKYEPVVRKSVGYCLNMTKTAIVIAETDDRLSDESEVCDGVSSIPRPWATKIKVLSRERSPQAKKL
jgi:hypothetical protein